MSGGEGRRGIGRAYSKATAEITPTTEMMVNSEESSARERTRLAKELDIRCVVSVTADAYMSAWPVPRTPLV